MRRIAVVMSHASRTTGGARRDLIFCAALRARGVEARLWRLHGGAETEAEEILGVPVRFCPSDNPEEIPHRQVSAALRGEIAAFAPDLLLFKGLGYRVNADVADALGCAIGFVVGGAVTDPLLPRASVVLGEYEEQLALHFPALLAERRALVMPKFVDLALAGDGAPPEAAEFDIVNVGTFAEARKNQGALLPLGARHSIAFIGGGPLLRDFRFTNRLNKKLRFLARLPHPEVFGVLRRSRIMVHSSVMDGLPRAAVEAMACGLPVVAYRRTIQGGIPADAGLLVEEDALEAEVDALLADDARRIAMGRAARAHVERAHGPAAIAAAAERMLGVV
jgi:hypothetical protein